MNSESLVLRQLAIRERRQYLDLVYSKDGAAPKRAGLVALSRAAYLLATRNITRPEARGHEAPEDAKLLWEWDWYFQYLEALVELTPHLQAAISDGKITPRGIKTRAPISLDQIRPWLEIDAKTAIAASAKTFMVGAGPNEPYSQWAGWADASVLPKTIFVAVNELAAWTDAEGIATPDEIDTLLSDVHHSTSGTTEPPAPPVPVVTPAAATIIRNKLRTDSLDPPIQKAIKQAGSLNTAAVFTCLKELALNGEALPFTGAIEGAALCYTNDDDTPAVMTKNALDKRLAKYRKAIA